MGTIRDVVVYRNAIEAAEAVSALLTRREFSKDFDLGDQRARSAGRVGSLIAEGFGQLTDRHLAAYLGRARGSALESHGHLTTAAGKKYISPADLVDVGGRYIAIGKMLTKWFIII